MAVQTRPPPNPATPTPPPFSIGAILLPLLAIVMGTFMAILDNTVVNVALPTLGRLFDADLRVLQWVISGYMLAQAAVIPLSGWLADRYGAKPLYLVSLAFFTLGSALLTLAPTAEALIAFRVIQGLGGGMLMPIGMTFLYRLAPPEKRGAVMGLFGIPVLLAPAIGPVLSGWMLQFADWRLIFLINVPIGLAAVLVGLRGLPSLPAQRAAGRLDTLGVVLGPIAFASLSYGISESTAHGWTGTPTLVGVGVGLVALVLFCLRELSVAEPLLDLRVFRSREFSLAIVTQWVGQSAMFGTLFLVPLFLQQVRGYGAFETGLFTLPQALASAAMMPVGGRLFDRFGVRVPAISGLLLVAAAMAQLTLVDRDTGGGDLAPALICWGAGMGLMMMPLNTHLLNSAPRHLVSRITSLSSALFNVVGSLAIATAATILQSRMADRLSGAAGAPSPELLQSATAFAFGDTYRVAVVMALLAIPLAMMLRPHRAAQTAPTEGVPHPV